LWNAWAARCNVITPQKAKKLEAAAKANGDAAD